MDNHITNFSSEELIDEINHRKLQREKVMNDIQVLKLELNQAKSYLARVSLLANASIIQEADWGVFDLRNRLRIKEHELYNLQWKK